MESEPEGVSEAIGSFVGMDNRRVRGDLESFKEFIEARTHETGVEAVAEAVRRACAGLADPSRPDGSFLFLGPTGFGTTELARTLAEALVGSEDVMVRLDMSEYQERHTVSPARRRASRLCRPRGSRTADRGGPPQAVLLLFDEIEKAHADVFNIPRAARSARHPVRR